SPPPRVSACSSLVALFVCHAPAPPELYTLSLHDALPISSAVTSSMCTSGGRGLVGTASGSSSSRPLRVENQTRPSRVGQATGCEPALIPAPVTWSTVATARKGDTWLPDTAASRRDFRSAPRTPWGEPIHSRS